LIGLIAKPQSGQSQAGVFFYQSNQIKSISLIDLTVIRLICECFFGVFVTFLVLQNAEVSVNLVRLSTRLKQAASA
jgi:hypothetical protein